MTAAQNPEPTPLSDVEAQLLFGWLMGEPDPRGLRDTDDTLSSEDAEE